MHIENSAKTPALLGTTVPRHRPSFRGAGKMPDQALLKPQRHEEIMDSLELIVVTRGY